MTKLHCDFETYSAIDLKAQGLDVYARDPSTGVHCMAYAFDDGPVRVATDSGFEMACLERGDAFKSLDYVLEHVRSGGLVYAHNAPFEWAIWNFILVPRYGWPELKIEQMRCTMAMAYAMALPGALEAAAPALGIAQRKDGAGKRIMLKWCKPKPDGKMWRPEDDPEQFAALCRYCAQDVEVERALHGRLMELSTSEQSLWNLDHRVNQRGVQVDLPSVELALRLVDVEKERLNQAMLQVTGGVVGSCTEVQLLVKWIRSQGVDMKGVAKAEVLDTLDGDLPANVRTALELRKEAAKSSTAKLAAMKERASVDGRVRGIHQFHGASTGRWAGRGIQVQNFPRPRKLSKDDDQQAKCVDEICDLIAKGDREGLDIFYGPVMDALADGLRGMLIAPPGKDLIAVDFNQVEARVLAWLAGEESVLEVFRTHGRIYEHAAADIYGCDIHDVTKEQRQIGKVAVLALGYGGGVGAFQSMAKNYFIKVPDPQADEIKQAWRLAHPKIVNYWYDVERAAIAAVREGGKQAAGAPGREVVFKKSGSFLWCRLPSGRVLCYPYPEMRVVTTPWGEEKDALTYMTVVSNPKAKIIEDPNSNGTWKRISTYGGSLAENVTQAAARDLLAEAMKRLDAAGFEIVMHVHDELVVEVDEASDEGTLKRVEEIMAEVPSWATGLPLAAEGWRGKKYRKG